VADGECVTGDPVAGGFTEYSKNIPMMAGSVLNEWVTMPLLSDMARTQSDNKNYWTAEQVKAKLAEKYGDKAEAITSAFLKAYPNKKPADALYVDTRIRSGALKTLNAKSSQKGAPVYAYVFTWETPIMGGFAMSYHCSELPFVFNNIAITEMAPGGGEKAQALADKMSGAWVEFARTGNPGWEAYTTENGATMIFDDESALRYHHDDELMKLLTE
ncbi:MAG: carboxylesterase family protein, partial [Synergistaceae bacterium]|nr:carboxylesterase family protein [Synergistaceae bacterium]